MDPTPLLSADETGFLFIRSTKGGNTPPKVKSESPKGHPSNDRNKPGVRIPRTNVEDANQSQDLVDVGFGEQTKISLAVK